MKRTAIVCLSLVAALVGCAKDEKKKDDKKPAAQASSPASGTEGGNGGNSGNAAAEEPEAGDVIYTGFEGSTDYSLLVPGFREITSDDPSIAKVEAKKFKMPEEAVDQLLEEAKAKNPDIDVERFKKFMGREQTSYLITPLKGGSVNLRMKPRENKDGQGGGNRPNGGGGGGKKPQGGFGGTKWNKGAVKLVITEYTAEQIAAGKKRYTTDGGGGNLRACKSCHEKREEGAPPHELGRVSEISDQDAMKWITTGEAEGRKAKIKHTWEFGTDEEEQGIVPYLRSLQTNDVETLRKLYFEQVLADGGFMPGGGSGGSGGTSGTKP